MKTVCPQCQRRLAPKELRCFVRLGVLRRKAPCPGCGDTLMIAPKQWRLMWAGITVAGIGSTCWFLDVQVAYYVLSVVAAVLCLRNVSRLHLEQANPCRE